MYHINFTEQADFLNSLAAVVELEQTPLIVYDGYGCLHEQFVVNDFKNLVSIQISFDKKIFETFIQNRLAAAPLNFALVYAYGLDFSKFDLSFFLKCKNAKILWRILTPEQLPAFCEGYQLLKPYPEQGVTYAKGMTQDQLLKLKKHLARMSSG